MSLDAPTQAEEGDGCSREKMWLDDVISALDSVYDIMDEKPEEAGKVKVKAILISLALQFCWTGNLTLNGKTINAWSVLRSELKDMVMTAHQKAREGAGKVNLPLGIKVDNIDDTFVAEMLMAAVEDSPSKGKTKAGTTSSGSRSASEAAVTKLLEKDSTAVNIKAFLRINPSSLPCRMHPEYQKVVQTAWQLSSSVSTGSKTVKDVPLAAITRTIATSIAGSIPANWIDLCRSVLDHIAGKSDAVDSEDLSAKSLPACLEHLFANTDSVMKFAGIRAAYLTQLVLDLCGAGGPFHSDQNNQLCSNLAQSALVNHLREFDLSTTDAEWAPKWTELLAAIRAHTGPLTKDSVDNAVKQIHKKKHPQEGGGSQD